MKVQNNSGAMLEIGGVKIKAGESADVPAWEVIKGTPIIKAWLRTGILSLVAEDLGEATGVFESIEDLREHLSQPKPEEPEQGVSEEAKTKSVFSLW
jgi:hypothetical protein